MLQVIYKGSKKQRKKQTTTKKKTQCAYHEDIQRKMISLMYNITWSTACKFLDKIQVFESVQMEEPSE